MTSQKKRALAFVVGAGMFLYLFLRAAGQLSNFNAALASGGITVIVSVVLLAIWLQERSDARHAKENLARIARVEAEESGRRLKQGLVG